MNTILIVSSKNASNKYLSYKTPIMNIVSNKKRVAGIKNF